MSDYKHVQRWADKAEVAAGAAPAMLRKDRFKHLLRPEFWSADLLQAERGSSILTARANRERGLSLEEQRPLLVALEVWNAAPPNYLAGSPSGSVTNFELLKLSWSPDLRCSNDRFDRASSDLSLRRPSRFAASLKRRRKTN